MIFQRAKQMQKIFVTLIIGCTVFGKILETETRRYLVT
jgi:hypothetical protein